MFDMSLVLIAGKTLAFGMPMLMISLQEEIRMPLEQNEGPIALCVNPSRELAVQTKEVLEGYTNVLRAVRNNDFGWHGD
jgi:ATP-dependent RNA helicase DDX41